MGPASVKRLDRHRKLIVTVGALACVLVPALSAAQETEERLPEIPLTLRMPFVARYAGMGGASIAVADDHAACLSNPATLGLVRGIEFAAGFVDQNAEKQVDYLGTRETSPFGKTRLAHLGFAYPFPTYRGRFVLGFQYGRINSFDSDFFKSGAMGGIVREEEGIYEEGGLGAYAVAGAVQVSPNVTVGLTGTILGGRDYRERTFLHETGDELLVADEIYEADVTAVSGIIGALIEANPGLRLGLTIELPQSLDFDGTLLERVPGEEPEEFLFSDEIDLPFRFGAGLAFSQWGLILTADAIYTDWSQIAFAGPLRTRDREFAYRETVELRAGAEYLPAIPVPLRLRAGYLRQPIAYRLLLTDVVERVHEEARFDHDRAYLTFGVGLLFGKNATADIAYLHGGFERSAPSAQGPRYREEEEDRRLLLTVSLRFN